jgi:glycosyltransferase involved in cell wall biosynthesis
MNIVLVSQEYPPETAHGGIGTQVYMRAHGLTELGHNVQVLTHSIDTKKHEYMDGRAHVTRIPGFKPAIVPTNLAMNWLSYSFEVAGAIQLMNAEKKIDLIVFPEYGGEGYIHLLNQTTENYIPSIVHIHGPLVMLAHTMDWPEINSEFYRIGTLMEGGSLRMADAISASTSTSANWCINHYGITNSEIPVLYTGIDTNHFYPKKTSKAERPTIVFVGAVSLTKGVKLLVESAIVLAKEIPELHLRIIGKGDTTFIAELRDLCIQSGVPDLLDIVGHVNRNDLPVHLSHAHFFAGPSKYEGGPGNVYLEAMACGIPAIGCSGSGVDGVIIPYENGLLVPPDNLEELVRAMRTLLNDRYLCNDLGKKARDYVIQKADSRVCLKKLEEFYKSVSKNAFQKLKNN